MELNTETARPLIMELRRVGILPGNVGRQARRLLERLFEPTLTLTLRLDFIQDEEGQDIFMFEVKRVVNWVAREKRLVPVLTGVEELHQLLQPESHRLGEASIAFEFIELQSWPQQKTWVRKALGLAFPVKRLQRTLLAIADDLETLCRVEAQTTPVYVQEVKDGVRVQYSPV